MQRLFTFWFRRLAVKKTTADHQLYLLSEEEQKSLRKLELITLWISALIGAVMVLVLYIPQYAWPDLFAESTYTLPFTDISFPMSILSLVYGIVLVYIEILMLTALHLYCAHEIAVRTGLFSDDKSKQGESVNELVRIGMEKKDKSLSLYGLDPFQGLSRWAVFLRNVVFTLKATLSNLLIKLLVRRLFGRYVMRAVLDLLGIPIFAFWNAWASRRVLREARVVIMGEHLLQALARQLKGQIEPAHHSLVYDALQFVAVSKRDYHSNHSRLAALVLNRYGIERRSKHTLDKEYVERFKQAPAKVQELCLLVIVLGMIIDGHLSVREKLRLDKLEQKGFICFSSDEVQQWCSDFVKGKGLNDLLGRFPLIIS
ncbi:MAG: hypothetical protein MUC87_04840 [Bacteroidia bacterium]|jgi:hypothetical protein|nr:hypothetical protein [Bacteroidia bacterium]